MKKLILLLILIVTTSFLLTNCKEKKGNDVKQPEAKKEAKKDGQSEEKASGSKDYVGQSKKLGKEFVGSLKKQLMAAIKEGGPVKAIEVCKVASPKSEAEFMEKNPEIISFRRISLKTRNAEKHTPTDNEKEWLTTSEEKLKAEGSLKPGMISGSDNVTVLLPIVIKSEKCLTCHGDSANMPDKLKETLKKNYPNDMATGYKMGDLRGALSIVWKK